MGSYYSLDSTEFDRKFWISLIEPRVALLIKMEKIDRPIKRPIPTEIKNLHNGFCRAIRNGYEIESFVKYYFHCTGPRFHNLVLSDEMMFRRTIYEDEDCEFKPHIEFSYRNDINPVKT